MKKGVVNRSIRKPEAPSAKPKVQSSPDATPSQEAAPSPTPARSDNKTNAAEPSEGGDIVSATKQRLDRTVGEIFDELLRKHERFIPVILLLICAASRFYRLEQPNGVVFDETHFGRFTNQYHAHTYLFDIHPPLGKLVFYYVGLLTGYDYRKCNYANIADDFGKGATPAVEERCTRCSFIALVSLQAATS
jgi:dolichyl-phosphate-mannose-protein mannosyltransferase